MNKIIPQQQVNAIRNALKYAVAHDYDHTIPIVLDHEARTQLRASLATINKYATTEEQDEEEAQKPKKPYTFKVNNEPVIADELRVEFDAENGDEEGAALTIILTDEGIICDVWDRLSGSCEQTEAYTYLEKIDEMLD